jgi:hypothetical protein
VVDVIGCGPERLPRAPVRSALRRAARRRPRTDRPRAGPARRLAVATLSVLVAAGALFALRSAAEPVRPPTATAYRDDPLGADYVYGRSRLQPPPFDRLPGRTPIPQPNSTGIDGRTVSGTLPAVGAAPNRATATESARLVLGRYCRVPNSLAVRVDPRKPGDWQAVRARVTRADPHLERVFINLRLRWNGTAYAWIGAPAELVTCS